MAIQRTNYRGFKLHYANSDAAESMCRESTDFPAFFSFSRERPLVVDCGANIGVSVLEWKFRWPQCEVLCFEPDPFAFELLQLNVDKNDIPGVTCINAAISDQDQEAILFGDIGPAADARGNSLEAAWGDRPGTSQHRVRCCRLSPLLKNRPVDFLKLDVEGVEERVLAEIADCLPAIEAMYVEIHETNETATRNSAERILAQLRQAGFEIDAQSRDQEFCLPPRFDDWKDHVDARQTQLQCWRQA